MMWGMVQVGRVYDEGDGSRRILVDRLWPRGMRKDDPRIDEWLPLAAPSTELRHWYGHRAEAFDEFARRYEAELAQGEQADAFARLAALVEHEPTTMVTATREVELSHLTVLARLLDERTR